MQNGDSSSCRSSSSATQIEAHKPNQMAERNAMNNGHSTRGVRRGPLSNELSNDLRNQLLDLPQIANRHGGEQPQPALPDLAGGPAVVITPLVLPPHGGGPARTTPVQSPSAGCESTQIWKEGEDVRVRSCVRV